MADFARGQLLVQLREKRRLSQEDAAHEIGTTAKSLRAWEHGGAIRWGNAEKLAEYYDIEPERLVSRELIEDNGTLLHPDEVLIGKVDEILSRFEALEAALALLVPALAEEPEKQSRATKGKSRTNAKRPAARRSTG